MKFSDIFLSANANLLRNKGRTILTIVAIFVGAFTIILTTGINTGVNGYIDKQLESAGGENHLDIMPNSTMENLGAQMGISSGDSGVTEYSSETSAASLDTISDEDIEAMRKLPGIESVDKYYQVEVEYIASDKTDKKYQISISLMPTDSFNVDMRAGKMVTPGAGQYQIVLQPDYAEALGFGSDEDIIGQKVLIGVNNTATSKTKEVEAVVTGVQNKSVVSMGSSWVNRSLNDKLYDTQMGGLPKEYIERTFFATAETSDDLTDAEIQDIKDRLAEMGFVAMTVEDEVGMIKSFFDAMTMVLVIFGVIALFAASLGIVNTLFMAVQERTREIGLMKAMGLGDAEIRLMFSIEAIMLGFWGSVVGIIVAFGARAVANSVAEETFLAELPGFTLIEFDPVTLIVFVLIIMFIALIAGTLPARRASKLDPIEALRYE